MYITKGYQVMSAIAFDYINHNKPLTNWKDIIMNDHNKKEDNIIEVTCKGIHRLLDNTYTLEFLESSSGWSDTQILRNIYHELKLVESDVAKPFVSSSSGSEIIYIFDINCNDIIKIKVEEGQVKVNLNKEVFANAYPALDLKPYKVNKSHELKIANAVRLLAKIFADSKDEPVVVSEEKLVKAYATAIRPKEYYLYKARNNFAELSQLVNMKTNTRSCMMRESIDTTLNYVCGAQDVLLDRYANAGTPDEKVVGRNWHHPFMSYEGTDDTSLLLVSERKLKAGEEITDNNPFIKRAIARHSSYTYKDRFMEEYSFAREYGADRLKGLHRYFVKANECCNTDDMILRIYDTEHYINVAPYIDGDSQYGRQVRTEGAICNLFKLPATVVVVTDDEDSEWKLDLTTGAEQNNNRYHNCAVSGEAYQEEDMVYIDEINDWVCDRFAFWDSASYEYRLDGKEILNYFR